MSENLKPESENLRPESVEPEPVRRTSAARRFVIYAGVLLAVFLLGFVPMWLRARESGRSLAAAEQQLSLARMQNNLASAAVDARRGDYEPARQAASQFFTTLREEVDKGDASTLTRAQREAAGPLFTFRDEIITLLARSDPASADRLSDLHVAYRKFINERGGS